MTSPALPGANQPRLIALAGPLYGEVLALSGSELTIGRDPSNQICVGDLSLSRRHCAISTGAAEPRIRDLGSSNGTFVNGMQISDRPLADGDRIQLGESVFLFIAKAPNSSDVHVTSMRESPAQPTTRLRIEEAKYLQPQLGDPSRDAVRTQRALHALLSISTAISALRKEEEIFHRLLDLITEAVPADQVAILAGDEEPGAVVQVRSSRGERDEVHGPVVRQVLTERVGVLARDTESILCVPMAVRGQLLGAIYVSARAAETFDDEHLQLLAAIGGIAAPAIDNARHLAWLETEAERLQTDLNIGPNLVGRSPKMVKVYDLVARVARADVTALIVGETGTGKELVARAIHLNSARAKRPFVAINCAALTETLLETELFGHERGAFTHAVAQKKGKLEVANGGTVFLDEIGELAPGLQSKLLRVLQEREFERVGGTQLIKIDVRVISATNRILADEVTARRFREDLYHRLNVVAISVPPLRERRDDIPVLANYFVDRIARRLNRPVRGISAAALNHLKQHDWPGNVRELENVVERAVVLGVSDQILLEDLPEWLVEDGASAGSDLSRLHDAVRETKIRLICDAFRRAGQSYTDAARILGVHPNYLHRLIRNLGIKAKLEHEQ